MTESKQARGVVAWARPVYARPVNAPEEWSEMVDVEFHTRPEKPEGEGWYPLVVAIFAQQPAAVDGAIDKTRFERAPCYLCGYNGLGYYQPDTHPCAAKYHAALEELHLAEVRVRELARKTLGAQKEVVAWARLVYARPVNAPEPAEEWDEVVDIEFHNRPEKPEGEGWRPLVLADTGDGAAPHSRREQQ